MYNDTLLSHNYDIIVETVDFAVIINPYNISNDELKFFTDFYENADGCAESIVFTQKKAGVLDKFKVVRAIEYENLFDMEKNLKYELLQAFQKTSKSERYSEKLAMLITILFTIRNKPYITTSRRLLLKKVSMIIQARLQKEPLI